MKNYFKLAIFSLAAVFVMTFAAASQPVNHSEEISQAELLQECIVTDYWIHTSSGEWIHIYFTTCLPVI
jgi:hypothetical protein